MRSSSTIALVSPAIKCDCSGGMQPSMTLATMKSTKFAPLDSHKWLIPLCSVVKMQYCSGASSRLPNLCKTSYSMPSTTSTGSRLVRVVSACRRNRLRSAHSHVMLRASVATSSTTWVRAALSTDPRFGDEAIARLISSASSNASSNIFETRENRWLWTAMRRLSNSLTMQQTGTPSSKPRQCSRMLASRITNTNNVITKPVQLSRLETNTLP
mmetsp:Transcript_52239/g.96688  ORF Transcript_52239/g.96688 Transcript_52239/m.96688 type:complete len:213 (-) Transcript_52239:159-797(-)